MHYNKSLYQTSRQGERPLKATSFSCPDGRQISNAYKS